MAHRFATQAFMANPIAEIAKLQTEGPVVAVDFPLIGEVWVTTTQEAAGLVLKDTERFAIRGADGKVVGTQWWMPKTIFVLANNMLTFDEPDHTRLRSLVDKAFHRRNVLDMEPHIQQTADALAENLFAEGEPVDLIGNFARRLPLAVICEMLGLPEKDRPIFSDWAQNMTSVTGAVSFLMAMRPIGRMRRYLEGEIARQRQDPAGGLIAELVKLQEEGAAVSDEELVAMVFLLLFAGHETTTHVISGGVLELLRDPDQREWLFADPSRLPLAVEELLRFVSAVQFSKPRVLREDVEICGISLKKGDRVMAMIAAANCDPDVFEVPEKFDLARHPNKHIAFGAGPHFCLGHQLARLEIACALRALFNRYPRLRLGVEESAIRWKERAGLRSLERLPVRAD